MMSRAGQDGCNSQNKRRRTFVVWTNKGGVGKTTLTFHTAVQYAIDNPDKRVLVIDACPQANISATLLTHILSKNGKEAPQLHRGEFLIPEVLALRSERLGGQQVSGCFSSVPPTGGCRAVP